MGKLMNIPENIITSKDLDYLSDMFQWNYLAYKKVNSDYENVEMSEISEVMEEAKVLFSDNLSLILDIMNNPGGDNYE